MRSGFRAAVIATVAVTLFTSLGVAPLQSLASARPATIDPGLPSGGASERVAPNPDAFPRPQQNEGVPIDRIPKKGQPKLESILSLLASAQAEGGSLRLQQVAQANGVKVQDESVRVVLVASGGTGAALRSLVLAAGGHPESDADDLLQATVPVTALSSLANDPAIRYARLPFAAVAQAVSEGRGHIGVAPWDRLGIQGRGTKIGIIDLGFANYEPLLGRELPAHVTAKSFRADEDLTGVGNDHGTAVAEVTYDIAPGADYYFANFSTEVEMANAADWMAAQGVNVIASAVGFPGAGPGDGRGGLVNIIVRKARERNILWVQAAGNFAQTHWAGQFTDPDGNGFHNFTPTDEGNTLILPPSPTGGERIYKVEITLTWDDWDCFCNDYDLFLLRNDAVVAQSTTWQNGSAPPQERISYVTLSSGRYWVAIQRFRSAKRANFDLFVNVDYNLEYRVPSYSLVIPADSPNALTVGAVALDGSGVEAFSSQGPTRDGRVKPDLLAPDGVSTETYGALGFSGTSASVPHVVGAAALFRSQRPSLSAGVLQNVLELRARRLGNTGKNSVVGWGSLLMGDPLPGALLPFVSKNLPGSSYP